MFLEGLLPLAGVVAGFSAIKGVVDAWKGLRAKSRVRAKLAGKIGSDAELQRLASIARERDLNTTEVRAAADVIMARLKELDLSERDRELIAQGLTQRSKSGEQRYVTELIGEG